MKGEESSSKAEQGSKTKEAEHPISRCQNFRTPDFKVRKFRTPQNQGAKSLGQKKPFSHTPTSRCEIPFQGANFLKSNFAHHCGRCEILSWHTCANFAHLKLIFTLCEIVCEIFAHHYSRCENFAHLLLTCEIISKKGAIFAHPIPRCEICRPRCENFAR